MPQVHLSETALARLQKFGKTDNVEAALRKLLDKVGADETPAQHGPALRRSAYHLPILRVLQERGGHAAVGQVLRDAEVRMSSDFTELDWETLDSGGPRRQKNINLAATTLINRGYLLKDRGVWEITAEGRSYLQSQGS